MNPIQVFRIFYSIQIILFMIIQEKIPGNKGATKTIVAMLRV